MRAGSCSNLGAVLRLMGEVVLRCGSERLDAFKKPVIAVVRQPVFSSGLKLVGGPRCLPRESDLGGAVRTDHKPDDGTCDCASPKPHLACFSRGREPSSRV